MEPSTRDLFQLARVYYDRTVREHEAEKPLTWEQLPPLNQAAKAEGIRAVLAEYRSWHPEPEESTPAPAPAVFTPQTKWINGTVNGRPARQWQRIEDVPKVVRVVDSDGDEWKFEYGRWRCRTDVGATNNSWFDIDGPNDHGPFTERVDQFADWELDLMEKTYADPDADQ